MQKLLRPILCSTMAAVMFFFAGIICYRAFAKDSGINPHELKNLVDNIACTSCHRQMPERVLTNHTRAVLPGTDHFATGPTAMCMPCHEESMDSHPLDVYPKYAVPADLPLDKEGGISCLTCHYTHGSLKSDHPCCSVSFMDRLLGSDRLKKSFLLRRENNNGELCRACHESY